MKRPFHAALLSAFLIISTVCCFAQGDIPVDLHTGTPLISVPLASITTGDLSDHVALNYNAKGVSVKTPNGYYGIGWNLQGGGRIYREVRGLPDDLNNSSKPGWLYYQSNVNAGAFGNTSDLSSSTCADEQTDFNTINEWNYLRDTEPDLFHYNLPGRSGRFVFDNSTTPVIKLIPYDDITIIPAFDDAGKIASFIVKTNDGNVFEFKVSSSESLVTNRSGVAPPTIEFLKTEYEQYKTTVSYNSEWLLSKITSPSGAFLKYRYKNEAYINKDDYQPDHTVFAALKENSIQGYGGRYLFYRKSSTNVKKLATIESSSQQKIELTYHEDGSANKLDKMLASIKVSDDRKNGVNKLVSEIIVAYDTVRCSVNCSQAGLEDGLGFIDYSDYLRKYLKSVKEISQCEEITLYTFTYKDRDLLPLPNSLSMDFWGYFNGKSIGLRIPATYVYPQLPPHERYRIFPIANYSGEKYTMEGADLSVNPNTIQSGTLESIRYGSGARTLFVYEPNSFYDAVANQTYLGGGLRIKSIRMEDGVNPEATMIKEFEYKDNTGKSSGRILSKPVYTVPLYEYVDPTNAGNTLNYDALVQAGKNPWLYLVARVDVDLARNNSGTVVGYEQVTVKTPGAGRVTYQYYLPGSWGDGSSGDWTPSINKFARSTVCPSLNLVTSGGTWTFPYSPDPNFDYERGLLSNKYEYNEQNVLVRETSVTYQHLFSNNSATEKVWGVTYHKMPYTNDVMFFSKYHFLTNTTKVTSIENTVVYDAANTLKKINESTRYFHESTAHRLVSRIQKTESDGTIYTSYNKYPRDYGIIPADADIHARMIGNLQTSRNATRVETYTSVQRPGEVEKFISGQVTKFNDFGTTMVLPQYQMNLKGTPLLSFAESSINPATKAFEVNANYETVSTFTHFTSNGKLLTSTGQGRTPASTVWGYQNTLPLAAVTNAATDQFAFSDFETTSSNSFDIAGDGHGVTLTVSGVARTGTYAIPANTGLSRMLQKAGDTYLISGWIKNPDANVTLTIAIRNSSEATLHSQSHTISPHAAYFYFEYPVSVASAPAEFEVFVQGSFSVTSNTPYLDDIAFYPSHADLISYTYYFPFGPSTTSQRDQTVFKKFGSQGKLKDIFDKDGNLLSHTDYFFPSVISDAVLRAEFTHPQHVYYNKPAQFLADLNCMDDVLYEWNSGAGYQRGDESQVFTFNTLGSKTVTLRVSHPYYGVKTFSKTITVELQNPEDIE